MKTEEKYIKNLFQMFQSDFGEKKEENEMKFYVVANHFDSIYFNAERHDRMLRHSTTHVTT